MTTTPAKKNYLNNKDILKEIHLSKNTYCSYTDKEVHQYDFIVDYEDNNDLERSLAYMMKPETIQRAKEGRAYRLSNPVAPDGTKIKVAKVDPESISVEDIVFRVMTWDHIPVAPKQPRKNSKPKTAKEIMDLEPE